MNRASGPRVAFALLLVLAGCGGAAKKPSPPPEPATRSLASPGVQTWGNMHKLMMENDTAAVVSLADLTPDPALYGVGALVGLRGEITIAGGEVWIATAGEGDASSSIESQTSGADATLLTAADVANWKQVPIERPIPFDSLDARIARLAAAAGVDTRQPFAFLIQGPLRRLSFHVIAGHRMPPGASGHEAHLAAAAKRTLDHADAVLVGFYSTAAEGVFTHFGSFTHVHTIIPALQASGHVDGVTVDAGATLMVPAP